MNVKVSDVFIHPTGWYKKSVKDVECALLHIALPCMVQDDQHTDCL